MNIEDLTYTLTHEEVGDLLADLSDLRAALPDDVLAMPKDNEGTEFTICDLLDDQIEFLSNLRSNAK